MPFIKINTLGYIARVCTKKFPGKRSNVSVNETITNRKEYTKIDQKFVVMHGVFNSLAKESLKEFI